MTGVPWGRKMNNGAMTCVCRYVECAPGLFDILNRLPRALF